MPRAAGIMDLNGSRPASEQHGTVAPAGSYYGAAGGEHPVDKSYVDAERRRLDTRSAELHRELRDIDARLAALPHV